MTAALEGGEWSAARPGRTSPPGKTRYPFYRRLGGPQGRSGRAEILVPTGMRSRTVQPLVSRYTDWSTRPTPSAYDPPLMINAASVYIIYYFHCSYFIENLLKVSLGIHCYFWLWRNGKRGENFEKELKFQRDRLEQQFNLFFREKVFCWWFISSTRINVSLKSGGGTAENALKVVCPGTCNILESCLAWKTRAQNFIGVAIGNRNTHNTFRLSWVEYVRCISRLIESCMG